ncbi:hypothetical protein COLO4_36290 [Corchorus olitorius]|uniref:Uncharacterized protein n=1 Tax=Corchorus olitorius TaxID=93759 RepID=A0A1R3GA48_9ROSI|nr:hypothetical protein COLO4_36290 [Corchorus olitorius]
MHQKFQPFRVSLMVRIFKAQTMEVLPAGWLQTLGFCSVPFPRPIPRFNSSAKMRSVYIVVGKNVRDGYERVYPECDGNPRIAVHSCVGRIRSRVVELASQPWTPNEKKVTILSPVCVSITGVCLTKEDHSRLEHNYSTCLLNIAFYLHRGHFIIHFNDSPDLRMSWP